MAETEYHDKLEELFNSPLNAYSLNWLNQLRQYDRVVIFGGGEHGKNWINMLKDYHIKTDFVCDNNQNYWGKQIEKISCISPSDLQKITGHSLVLIAVRNYQTIYEQLITMGIDEKDIMLAATDVISFRSNYLLSQADEEYLQKVREKGMKVADICEDELSRKICYQTLRKWFVNWKETIDYTGESYFIPEIDRRKHEVFVDAGAYNGDTLESFLKIYGESFDKYYAFEMDTINYRELHHKVVEMSDSVKEKVFAYNIGLGNEKKEIYYNSNYQTSKINSHGEHKGFIDRLDDILKNEAVTFIKMDIEGAEMDALEGCMELINKNKPALAISIYHSIDDFLNIPIMLKRVGYRIIIRHHALDDSDIVCYAYAD